MEEVNDLFSSLFQTYTVHVGTQTHYIRITRTSIEDHSSRFTLFSSAGADHFNCILAPWSETLKAIKSVTTNSNHSHTLHLAVIPVS